MSTKTKKRVMIDAADKLAEIESWAPKGWSFQRAAYATTEEHGEGVRIWFSKKPLEAPQPILKEDGAQNIMAVLGKPLANLDPQKPSVRYLAGKAGLEVTFEDGSKQQIPRQLADLFFDYRPTRRPTLRLLSKKALQGLQPQFLDAVAIGTPFKGEDVIVDVLLSAGEVRELFGLGDNVAITGVRGVWEGEPVPGRGVCTSFAIRCVEV